MNPLTLIGAIILSFSLLTYGLGSITLQRFKLIGRSVLLFLSFGFILDIAAIVILLKGTPDYLFSVYAILHYFAALIMLIYVTWVWKVFFKGGLNTRINEGLHWFAKFAYGIWAIVYLVSSLLIIF
jgi:hypothetical protein